MMLVFSHLLDFLSVRSPILHLFTPVRKLHPEQDRLVLLKHTAKQSPGRATHPLPKATRTHTNVCSYSISPLCDLPILAVNVY